MGVGCAAQCLYSHCPPPLHTTHTHTHAHSLGTPALDNVLCIAVDNSPLAGSFLTDPGSSVLTPAALLSDPAAEPLHSFAPPTRSAPLTLSSTSQVRGYYAPGDRVIAAIATPGATSGDLRAQATGWWALPAEGPTGACDASAPGAFARFGMPLEPVQCSRVPAPLSAQTCEALSSARYTTALELGFSPNATFSDPSSFFPIVLGSITVANASSGALSTGAESDAASVWSPSSSGSPCSCSGIVTGVSYRVNYDSSVGLIARAFADVIVTTVLLPASACGDGSSSAPPPLAMPLTVALTWVDTAPLPPAAAASATRSSRSVRSGSPGYLLGAPLLAGVLVTQSGVPPSEGKLLSTEKLALLRSPPLGSRIAPLALLDAGSGFSTAGLTLRGPGPGGACVPISAAYVPGVDTATPIGVTFGEDLVIACTLALDEPSLSSLCYESSVSGGASSYPFFGLWGLNATLAGDGSAVTSTATHVGAFGNADPWKAWEWVPLTLPTSALPSATWDGASGVCRGIPAALNLEFLYIDVGEAANPQARIAAAVLSYSPDTWVFSREDVRDTANADGSYPRQTFTLTTTVTWSRYTASRAVDYVAPDPPLIPSAPADLWYPFAGSSG